jgi:hypothetical protein
MNLHDQEKKKGEEKEIQMLPTLEARDLALEIIDGPTD